MGGVNFSPEFIVWKKWRDEWNSVIRCHKGGQFNRTIMNRRAKACGIQQPMSITLTEYGRAYKICRDELERLKPDVDIYRESFLALKVKE